MLTKWVLKNFKSVRRETDLELAPLTVFAGANSSGKSTIIQSILLTAQTLQSPVHGKSVVLNGHILRLGAYSDLMSAQEPDSKIAIGFALKPAGRDDSAVNAARLASETYFVSHDLTDKTELVECSYSFTNVGAVEEKDILDLQPRLLASHIRIKALGDQTAIPAETEIEIARSGKAIETRAANFNLPAEVMAGPEQSSLEYEVLKPQNLRPGRRYFRGFGLPNTAKSAGAVLSHFLPLRLTIVYDSVEEDVRNKLEPMLSYRESRLHSDENPRWADVPETFKTELVATIHKIIESRPTEDSLLSAMRRSRTALVSLAENFTSRAYTNVLQAMPNDLRATLLANIAENLSHWRSILRGERLPSYVIRYAPLPALPAFAVDYVKTYFSTKLKYLGPLRDEPKPVYPLSGATDSRDVGFKGEHTAAVLDIHKNTLVSYIPTSAFADRNSVPQQQQVLLSQAVADWLNYMGVVQHVRTVDRGKLGHELKVATTDSDSNILHDLTHVGVGVSQVLPILVLSILAEQDSTLIFEQPELHLHPRVQTRLAEFFVSMIMLKKQCIVETHSEYLINRLRYLAAVSTGNAVSANVILYFVEKAQGQSSYTPIRINEFGAIPDWPKGFFDENEETAAQTLRAALTKRRSHAQR